MELTATTPPAVAAHAALIEPRRPARYPDWVRASLPGRAEPRPGRPELIDGTGAAAGGVVVVDDGGVLAARAISSSQCVRVGCPFRRDDAESGREVGAAGDRGRRVRGVAAREPRLLRERIHLCRGVASPGSEQPVIRVSAVVPSAAPPAARKAARRDSGVVRKVVRT
ncbi:hypothetical protein GS432_05285 [Rhodococcus hoagii]|nr:hypothetical protein [Prescottella equi]